MSLSVRSQFGRFNALGGQDSFPDPFADISSQAVPDQWKNTLLWCLTPGTPIELSNLRIKPIEAIVPGDFVLTRGGTHERVLATSERSVSEEIVHLSFAGLGKQLSLKLTSQHNLWRIRTPRLKPGRVASGVKFERAEKVPASQIRVGDYIATPLPRRPKLKSRSRFSGWLVGLYAAEGNVAKVDGRWLGVRFTLGAADERLGIVTELQRRLADECGLTCNNYTPPSRPDIRVVVCNDVELPDWIAHHVPGLAKSKHLDAAVLSYGDDFLLGFLGGLLDGDGHISQSRGRFYGAAVTSASLELLYQSQRIAHLLGMTPSLCQVQNKSFNGEKDGSLAYVLTFGKHDVAKLVDHSLKLQQARKDRSDFEVTVKNAKQSAVFIRDGYVFRRVRHIELAHYEGSVYNFEVENDHSYVANGVTVANCEHIHERFGTYKTAMERIISYFLTDVEISGDVSDQEKQKFEDFLRNTLDVIPVLQDLLRDRGCYGNGFSTVLAPFKRFLQCPKTGDRFLLNEVAKHAVFKFEWDRSNFQFIATCPRSGWRGPWKIVDEPDNEEQRIRVKRWSPHQIELLHDPYTTETAYLWRIPEDYKKLIRDGSLYHLERCSEEVLKAIKHNQLFRFHNDVVFHMKEPTLAGISNQGWGMPRILSNFRQIWHVQVLRRYNEAIALDYVIPFRLITPAERSGGSSIMPGMGDSLFSLHGGDFRRHVKSMLRQRRRDPATWHVLPFPVHYQMLGGEANQLAPRDLMDQAMETLLNDVGTPVELYRGSLQVQTAPVALRLFESTWHHLVHDANQFLRWLVRQVSQIMGWEQVEVTLKRVTIADDMNKQMAALQLMMGQQLSGHTGLKALGHDWDLEQKLLAEEARKQQELQARMQEEMEQAGFAQEIAKGQMGGPAPAGGQQGGQAGGQQGGQPGPDAASAMGMYPVTDYIQSMGPNTPVSPNDLLAAADQLASQLLGMPESMKDSELRKLSTYNSVLHGLVRANMDKKRQQARTQGGAMVMQQQYGGGGGQPVM